MFSTEEEQIIEDIVISFIIEEEKKMLQQKPNQQKRKRAQQERVFDFWNTAWGQMISHPDVGNPKSRLGKRFRRRFRVPFPLFTYIVEICKEENIFDLKYESRIPYEAKILACLRILGRSNCADDISELCGNAMGESTINAIFKYDNAI